MSPIQNLRTSILYVLMFSLVVIAPINIATLRSHASNKSLRHSLTPTMKESSEETGPQSGTVDDATRARISEAYNKLPMSFEENRGQVDSEVKYVSRGSGYSLFLTETEAVLALQRGESKKAAAIADNARPSPVQPRLMRTSVVRMKLTGANRAPAVTGETELGVRTNYFIGNEPENWHTDVARYEQVRYSQVYPGIDMIYYGEQRQLEYDFEVAPGADTSQIALEFEGVKRVKIERETGDLVLKIAGGEVRQHKPVTYQMVGGERQEIQSWYVVNSKRKVGIEVGEYDHTKRLVIDPVLSYSTYLGGGNNETGRSIAIDASGIAYVTGNTGSPDFPTLHQYQTGRYGAFVTKLDTNLSGAASLLYSTYLGGTDGGTDGYGIAVDSSGIAYVTGETNSTDFPTLHQYQTHQDGFCCPDVFVTKLDTNASGAASLLYSTYLSGRDWDQGFGIAVDSSGHAYVTGRTFSSDFPIRHQYQRDRGASDAFVAKLDTNASGAASLLYSTYLGGDEWDEAHAIAVDASGNAYVTGYTESPNFPTKHQYQSFQAGPDAFVAKLNPNLSGATSLLYSTFLGGSNGSDGGYGIAVDAAGNAYVTGITDSSDFPTLNQYQTYQGGGLNGWDAFVAKLNPNLSGGASLLYSTYLGGNDYDSGQGIAVDSSGIAYVTGETGSSDFPTLHPYQIDQGETDAFVAKLDTNASGAASLLYSTYLGGNLGDSGNGIAVDAAGHAYVTGTTFSTNFPKLHPYQATRGGTDYYSNDAFVTKLTDTYSISGRVTSGGTNGISGVTMTISGSLSRTVVTNRTGNYSFELVVGGNYTITPIRSGLTFIPSKQSFNDLHANQTNVNFTTKAIMLSGHVTLSTSAGAGLAGVTITLTGGAGFTPRSVNTTSNGAYSFSHLPTPGNYKITPSKTNYTFSPAQLILINVTANQTDTNFIATLKTYTISGVVKLGSVGLSGVTVVLTSPTPAGFAPRTATTDSAGAYSLTSVPAERDYTVTPTKPGYQFTPISKSFNNLSGNQAAINFAVTVYSISGRITRTGTSTGISGVTVTLMSPTPANFAARTVQTGPQGNYQFTVLPAGRDYTIEPMKTGFTFTPATQSITNLSSNIAAGALTNFTGTGP